MNNSSISSSDDLPICRDQIQNQADGDIHLELWRRQVEMLNLVAQATLNSIIKRSQDPKMCNMAGKCSISGGFHWKIIYIYILVYIYYIICVYIYTIYTKSGILDCHAWLPEGKPNKSSTIEVYEIGYTPV